MVSESAIDDFETDYRDEGKMNDHLYRINVTTVRWGARVIGKINIKTFFCAKKKKE